MKKTIAVCLTILICLVIAGCGNDSAPHLFLFGLTELNLDNAAAEREIAAFLQDFERKASVSVEGSDVYRINQAGAGEDVVVSDWTRDNLLVAKRIYAETGGAFNPALFPLTEAWGFSPEHEGKYGVPRPEPDKARIEELLAYCDLDDIALDGNTVTKRYAESKLDLGGIAKGYAAGIARDIALRHGVTHGIVNIGGSQYFIGEKPGGLPYNVGINDPRKQLLFGRFEVADASVSTSGDYMRYYEYGGKRYCHILDPTGYPITTGVASVTVVTSDAAAADAYATAASVMGQERAAEFFEEQGIAAVLVFESDGAWYYRVTGGLKLARDSVNGAYTEWTSGKN